MLADAVAGALAVVPDALAPAERVAFVLRDVFAVPFEEVAAVGGLPGRLPDHAAAGRPADAGRAELAVVGG